MKIEAHRKILLVAIFVLLFVPLLATTSHGEDSLSEFKLSAGIDYAMEFDQFGYSVDISGNTAVVGAPFSDLVYVFQYDESISTWGEDPVAVLTAPVPAGKELFGWSVAIDGDTVVVGTLDLSSYIGSAYVFTRSGGSWNEGQQLIFGAGIGASVAISGDTVVVGSIIPVSSAYVFRYLYDDSMGTWDWVQETELKAPPGAPLFGWAVDLSGDTAVVGAPLPGSAYAFTRNGDSWDEGQELITGPWVGSSVATDGETVVVGAPSLLPLSSQVPQGPGSAYVFSKDANGSWQQQELPNPGVDGFGASVAISGDRLLVGAPTDDVACPDDPICNSGSVQMFYYDGENWIQDPHHPVLIPTLEPSPEKSDQFGWAITIDGSRIAVGARFGDAFAGEPPDPPITEDAGSASVFILAPPNHPPIAIAEASPDEVREGKPFTLNGLKSEDPDGDPLLYNWVQIAGTEADLELASVLDANDKKNQAVQTFVAPELSDGCDKLTFELTVTEDVDGGLSSEPVTVDIRVVPINTIHSKLEREHRHWLYWHKYTFEGAQQEKVTLTLQADPDGLYRGKRATLILKDKIKGARLFETDRGSLPNTISATLPADGIYNVYVLKQPWFWYRWRHKRFKGDHILTLEGTCGKLKRTPRFRSYKCKPR